MSPQNEKSKQMENQNKPNSRSTSRHHGDVTQSHGDVMLQTGSRTKPTNMTDCCRVFEDDIIGLRARTVSPCEMAIHS